MGQPTGERLVKVDLHDELGSYLDTVDMTEENVAALGALGHGDLGTGLRRAAQLAESLQRTLPAEGWSSLKEGALLQIDMEDARRNTKH